MIFNGSLTENIDYHSAIGCKFMHLTCNISLNTPSEQLVRMSQICAWAILCREYLEPNLSIFEVHLMEMQEFLYFCAISWSVMGMFWIYDV